MSNMQTFQVTFDSKDVIVHNSDGVRLNYSDACDVALRLRRRYAGFAYVYFMRSTKNPDEIKIGVSKELDKRSQRLKAKIIHSVKCKSSVAYAAEKTLHVLYEDYRVRGEWFLFPNGNPLSGNTEFLNAIRAVKKLTSVADIARFVYQESQVRRKFESAVLAMMLEEKIKRLETNP